MVLLWQETHDGTLTVAASALSNCCTHLRSDIPKELLDWFKKAPSLKASTPPVRIAYLNCMIALFKSDNLQQVISLHHFDKTAWLVGKKVEASS